MWNIAMRFDTDIPIFYSYSTRKKPIGKRITSSRVARVGQFSFYPITNNVCGYGVWTVQAFSRHYITIEKRREGVGNSADLTFMTCMLE
jgi:hypothetical protein